MLVLASTADGKILYTRQVGWPEGAWGLVSGYVEEGETAEVAAVREVREETGLTARVPVLIRTIAFRDMLLICIEVDVDDAPPHAASDAEAACLIAPELSLTPANWPARNFIEEHLQRRRTTGPPTVM